MWKSGNPIEELKAENTHQFLTMLLPTNLTNLRLRQCIFRGQANAHSWSLLPSALRKYDRDKGINWPDHIVEEYWRVRDFMLESDKTGLAIPGDSPDFRERREVFSERNIEQKVHSAYNTCQQWPLHELLWQFALAQHYGIPTTLLDWTEQPYIAAYFAAVSTIKEKSNEPLAVWVLNVDTVTYLFPFGRAMTDPLGIYLVNVARVSNGFLSAQKGLFTVMARQERMSTTAEQETLEFRIHEIDKHIQEQDRDGRDLGSTHHHGIPKTCPMFNAPFLMKISLSADQAPNLLESLDQLGYHAGTLYPGYQGVSQMFRERREWLGKMVGR